MKFTRKESTVDAVQWHPGMKVDGVRSREKVEIIYSADGLYFYVSKGDLRPRQWVSVNPIDGPVPDEKKGGVLNGWAEIKNQVTGRVYHREVLPFNFWDVRSGKHDEFAYADLPPSALDLVLDYAAMSGWPEDQLKMSYYAWVEDGDRNIQVKDGSWIVNDAGKIRVYDDATFRKLFKEE
jgi:hypothetical protein